MIVPPPGRNRLLMPFRPCAGARMGAMIAAGVDIPERPRLTGGPGRPLWQYLRALAPGSRAHLRAQSTLISGRGRNRCSSAKSGREDGRGDHACSRPAAGPPTQAGPPSSRRFAAFRLRAAARILPARGLTSYLAPYTIISYSKADTLLDLDWRVACRTLSDKQARRTASREQAQRSCVHGESTDQVGVIGISENFVGVWGESQSPANAGQPGVFGKSPNWQGVHGESTDQVGVIGISENFVGVWGEKADPGERWPTRGVRREPELAGRPR